MSIYNKGGIELTEAYNKSGVELEYAYDYNGVEVYNNSWVNPYEDFSVTNIGGRVGQGIDVYGEVLFDWNESGQEFRLWDLDSSPITRFASISTGLSGVHGNDISFAEEFYDQSDEFPLLVVANRFYRVTRESATLVRTITIPAEVNDYNYYGTAFVGNYYYLAGYKYSYQYRQGNNIRIIKLDMSDLTDNGDGTYTPALLDTVYRDWLECIQGMSYHDGMIWLSCGIGQTAHIYGLNPADGTIKVDIELSDHSELEGCAWAYNEADDWHIIFGQRTSGYNGYKKVVFAEQEVEA